MYDDDRDDQERRERRNPDQVELPTRRGCKYEMRQDGEHDQKGDPEPQVAADLRQCFGPVRALELLLEGRLESKARESPLQLQRVRRLRRSAERFLRLWTGH